MRIAIIGAGFTGLAAAWDLRKAGHEVVVFEASDEPGGLAAGWQAEGWEWPLEYHYHHIFTSDKDMLGWLQELGLRDQAFFQLVKTSWRYQNQQFRFDSPVQLLRCPVLSWTSKFRVAAALAYLRFLPVWKRLEGITAEQFLLRWVGTDAYEALFQPLLDDKFGRFASTISAAWFWARIHVRSPQLGYFQGGFGTLAKKCVQVLQNKHITIKFSSGVEKIEQVESQWKITVKAPVAYDQDPQQKLFDTVLVTMPAPLLNKLVPTLPTAFQKKITQLNGLAAATLVLELNKPFFADKTYWLSVNERDFPFLAAVEHTNLVDKSRYGGKTLVYVGKYLEQDNPLYAKSSQELLDVYQPFLDQLSPGFAQHVTRHWVWRAPFAQPVVGINHSQFVPHIATPLPGLFWASMQHVYPFDRGTNFAVQIGRQAAGEILSVQGKQT